MKKNISQLLDSVITDNEDFVRKMEMTYSEYLLANAENSDNGWLFYLTDDEVEEFENDDDKAEKHIDEIKLFVNRFYNYRPAIHIKEEELREVLKKELKNAQDFQWTGWRIPIYAELNGEVSSGSWLSQGSWQPGATEVHAINTWNMGDLGYLNDQGEEEYDEGDVKDEISEMVDFIIDHFEGTAKSSTSMEFELV